MSDNLHFKLTNKQADRFREMEAESLDDDKKLKKFWKKHGGNGVFVGREFSGRALIAGISFRPDKAPSDNKAWRRQVGSGETTKAHCYVPRRGTRPGKALAKEYDALQAPHTNISIGRELVGKPGQRAIIVDGKYAIFGVQFSFRKKGQTIYAWTTESLAKHYPKVFKAPRKFGFIPIKASTFHLAFSE